jgi:hypothetical protein
MIVLYATTWRRIAKIHIIVTLVVEAGDVVDNALGSQGRRQVAEWDLRDAKGALVSEGSYLVRGVVKTADGKRDKVSVVLGVR